MEYTNIRFAGIGRYLPDVIVNNSDLEEKCGLPKGFCNDELGIKERREEKKLTQSEMGAIAAREALADAETSLFEVDLILNASITFEKKIPDNAPLIQKKIDGSNLGIPAFTIQSGINSFITALDMISNLFASKRYKCILLVCSDILSEMTDETKPYAKCTFGDGAAAVVLKAADDKNVGKLFSLTRTDYSDVISSLYGMRIFNTEDILPSKIAYDFDYNKYKEISMELISELTKYSVKKKMIGIYQGAAKLIPKAVPRNIKVYNAAEKYGICGTASIMLVLYDLIKEAAVKNGDKLMLLSVGDGLAANLMVIEYLK